MTEIKHDWQKCREHFQAFVEDYFASDKRLLAESMLYTLRQGKKFRPFLSYATARVFSDNTRTILAYSVAVEMVHAFSLIHDDLPALDNDDFRRGMQTNHKVYGEDVAILAGDALINEAYLLIANYYESNPSLALDLIRLLTANVGRNGMIEGQILDLKAQKATVDIEELKKIHQLKTACLIQAAILGAAKIHSASQEELDALKTYGSYLGLGFQIADDLLEEKHELGSYVHLLGQEAAAKALQDCSDKALAALKIFGESADLLRALVKENLERNH